MAAGLILDPCPIYDWCIGHEASEMSEDRDLHQGSLEPVTEGGSTISLDVDLSPEGLSFALDMDYWTIPADSIEAEFAEFRAQLDRMEAQAKEVRQTMTVGIS